MKTKSSTTIQTPNKLNHWLPALVIVVLAFILYGNTIGFDYCLDDEMVITDNAFTQEGVQGIGKIFKYDTFTGWYMILQKGMHDSPEAAQAANSILAGGRYRPLSVATFALEISLFGHNPHQAHFVNIVLYILATLLLYAILKKLFPPKDDKRWWFSLPFVASLLFLAHPLHTEVVANIKGRDEIMTLLGSLGALWFSIKYCEKKQIRNLIFSFICLFLGLLSKENAITFVAVIPIAIYYFVEKDRKTIVRVLVPLLAAAAAFVAIRTMVLGSVMQKTQTSEYLLNNPFLECTVSQKYAIIFLTLLKYLQLLIFPHPLTWDYYPYHIPIVGWDDWRAIAGIVIYVAMGVYAIYGLIRKRDIPSFCIWMYLIPLSIVSNIFFPIGVFMGERFIFISSIGFCIFIAWLLVEQLPKLTRGKLTISLVIFGIMISLYGLKTITRNPDWRDSNTLYMHDLQISKNSIKSNYNVGCIVVKKIGNEGLVENSAAYNKCCRDAIKYMQKVEEISPNYYEAHYFLGLAWDSYNHQTVNSLNEYAEALRYHNEELHQTMEEVLHGISLTTTYAINLMGTKDYSVDPNELIKAIDRILVQKDDIADLHHLKGMAYGMMLNNLDAALSCFDRAEQLGCKDAPFYRHYATANYLRKNYQRTLDCYRKILELVPNDRQTLQSMGYVYREIGNTVEAEKCFALAENN